jgi:hypothetical protein
MIHKRKQRELEATQNAKIFELYHAEAEGRRCLCGHSPAFHWDHGQGRCVDADCGCDAYDENVSAGIDTRDKKQRAADDEDGLARAMRQTQSADIAGQSWEQAVLDAKNPRRIRKRHSQSPKTDQDVLDALRALGGDPDDLSDWRPASASVAALPACAASNSATGIAVGHTRSACGERVKRRNPAQSVCCSHALLIRWAVHDTSFFETRCDLRKCDIVVTTPGAGRPSAT